MRNEQDAEDVVQEAALRAFRFFDGFRGQNSRAWFLRIVRNTAFTAMKEAQGHQTDVAFDEELHTPDLARAEVSESESDVVYDRTAVRAAIDQLPPEFREVI